MKYFVTVVLLMTTLIAKAQTSDTILQIEPDGGQFSQIIQYADMNNIWTMNEDSVQSLFLMVDFLPGEPIEMTMRHHESRAWKAGPLHGFAFYEGQDSMALKFPIRHDPQLNRPKSEHFVLMLYYLGVEKVILLYDLPEGRSIQPIGWDGEFGRKLLVRYAEMLGIEVTGEEPSAGLKLRIKQAYP